MFTSLASAFRNLGRKPRRRNSARRNTFEILEPRELLTVDLLVEQFSINGFLDIQEQPDGSLTLGLGLLVRVRNTGTTNVDLTNGTPNDSSDDPQVQFFLSNDATLDAGDEQLPAQSLSGIGSAILAGQSRQVTFLSGFDLGTDDKFLFVELDGTNLIAEDNENNNTASLGISVPHVAGSFNNVPVARGKTRVVDAFVSVADGDSPDYNGGQIQATILAPQAGDSLRFLKSGKGADRLRLAGSTLKLGNQDIGTVTGNKTTTLTIDLIAPVDRRIVQRAMRRIAIRGLVDAVTTRDIQFQVRDETSQSSNTSVTTVEFE